MSSVTQKILDEMILYMRQITIKVQADKFPPLTDLIRGTFDGVPVSLVPDDSNYKGSVNGTLKSDINGLVTSDHSLSFQKYIKHS